MRYRLTAQIEAILKVDDAFNWYEDQQPGLGDKFIEEVEVCYEHLRVNPWRYSFINHQYRRIKTNRFPYIIMYEIEGDTVIVTNVRHTKQKPL